MKRACQVVVVCLLDGGLGCVDEADESGIPGADFDAFVSEVQPVLDDRCANPSCHGTERRPLEIYAPSLHRADPDAIHSSSPLTDLELEANFGRSCGFLLDLDRPRDSLLLSKPLAMSAGGTAHADIVVFETDDDAEFVSMLDWVTDAFVRGEASE